MHLSQTAKGRLLIISTALLWGLAGVCVKSIPWSAFSIMSARCMICILILSVDRRGKRLKITKRNVCGAVMESLTGILYMSSIKLTTAATAIVLQYTAPIFVFLYTALVQKNKPRLRDILILCTVFGGCVLSFADGLAPQNLLGNLLGLASGMTFAGQIIFFGEKNKDADSGILLGNIFSAVVCFPAFFFDGHLDLSAKTIFWVLVLGVFQYGLANLCFAHGCTKLKKTETSLLLTIEPIFNPIPVWLVTGEIPGPLAVAGFFVVIAGITAYTLTRGKKPSAACGTGIAG